MKKTKIILISASVSLISLISCEDENVTTESSGINYVVTLRNQASSESTADYYLLTNDLMSGEISAVGQGIELSGWNYVGNFGDTYFAFGYTNSECIAYKVVDSTLEQQGKLLYDQMDMFAPIDDELFLAIGAPWGGGSYNCNIQVVDIENIAISNSLEHPLCEIYYSDADTSYQLNCWPTFAYVEDDRLFIFYYPLDGTTWATPNTDTAYASIFSYPELSYITTIKDSRTSPIGYYASQPCVIEDENGNHYTLSNSSYAVGYTQSTKPSGILKINAGEEKFDEDYFFNIEDNYGYHVLTAAYAGDGKIVANVISEENDIIDNIWGASSTDTPLLETAIIDLENETLTLVKDVPSHGGQGQTPFLVEDGMVYISVNNGTDAYIYQINANTATATKGAKIIGNELQGIFTNK